MLATRKSSLELTVRGDRGLNTPWSQHHLQLFVLLMDIILLFTHSTFPLSREVPAWVSIPEKNPWSDSIGWVLSNNNLHTVSWVLLINKNGHIYMQARTNEHATAHVHKDTLPLPHLSVGTGTIPASSLPPPLCLLLLSFSTCLWSPASFTIQSSACSSSPLTGEWAERGSEKEGVVPFG